MMRRRTGKTNDMTAGSRRFAPHATQAPPRHSRRDAKEGRTKSRFCKRSPNRPYGPPVTAVNRIDGAPSMSADVVMSRESTQIC
jgi:hypothetical protein